MVPEQSLKNRGLFDMQVNYHASNEYEALVNYKVLQQGFTGINLTRVRLIWSTGGRSL